VPGECGSGPINYLLMEEELAKVYEEAGKKLRHGDVLLKEGLNGDTVGNGLIGISLNGKCLKTGCSNTSTGKGTNDVCCGQGRCCRMGSVVQCFCGDCPPPPERCSQFCTSYLSSNGKMAAGCTDENTCDECSNCIDLGNFQGTACAKKIGGAPCWCENGGCYSKCDKCGEDGACTTDCENCQTCYKTVKFCDSGAYSLECCYSACDLTTSYSTCRDSFKCPDPPGGGGDPCAGDCYGQTFCDEPVPPCPDGASCTDNGFISAGGKTCNIRTVCDKSNVPESCKECDCNCDNDCKDCEICDASGECVPDPNCCDPENEYLLYRRTYRRASSIMKSYSWGPLACDNDPPGYFSNGTPCRLKCGSSEGTDEVDAYVCFKRSEGVTVGTRPNNFVGYSNLGCCTESPGTTYFLKTKSGAEISGSAVTINGGSSASGGGQQNNCYFGGYHYFELVSSKCGTCPSAPA
jgi:hypothetical protein